MSSKGYCLEFVRIQLMLESISGLVSIRVWRLKVCCFVVSLVFKLIGVGVNPEHATVGSNLLQRVVFGGGLMRLFGFDLLSELELLAGRCLVELDMWSRWLGVRSSIGFDWWLESCPTFEGGVGPTIEAGVLVLGWCLCSLRFAVRSSRNQRHVFYCLRSSGLGVDWGWLDSGKQLKVRGIESGLSMSSKGYCLEFVRIQLMLESISGLVSIRVWRLKVCCFVVRKRRIRVLCLSALPRGC
ncbi:hypothetical protein Droror1_Dr00027981 [Drosera rotundifolia]